jgi:hypothetical protein
MNLQNVDESMRILILEIIQEKSSCLTKKETLIVTISRAEIGEILFERPGERSQPQKIEDPTPNIFTATLLQAHRDPSQHQGTFHHAASPASCITSLRL